MSKNQISLEELYSLVEKKISAKEKNSYTYELAQKGVEKISRKVGEEALEVVIAAFLHNEKPNKKFRGELVGEICDLFFHTFVLSAQQGIEFKEIIKELDKRSKAKK